jgi:hypothetical protein
MVSSLAKAVSSTVKAVFLRRDGLFDRWFSFPGSAKAGFLEPYPTVFSKASFPCQRPGSVSGIGDFSFKETRLGKGAKQPQLWRDLSKQISKLDLKLKPKIIFL